MHVKLAITLLGSALLSLFAAGAGFAAMSQEPNLYSAQLIGGQPRTSGSTLNLSASVTSTITNTETPTMTLSPGNEKIANAIADRFGVSVSEVLTVHDEIHGWGGVFMVFFLAEKSGKSPQEILTMREDGGWGKIFKELGLHPGLKTDNLGGAITGRPPPTSDPTELSPNPKANGKDSTKTLDDEENPCAGAEKVGKGQGCGNPNPLWNLYNRLRRGNGKGK
jgi:hypothetical protein